MLSFRGFLAVVALMCALASLMGCAKKETVKTAKEKPKATRVPPPPGK
jgi:hypothetical protein